MARQLIESMTGPWQPSDYRATYTDWVNVLIEAKENDEEFKAADEAPPGTTVVDLTEALRASVEAAKKTPDGKRGGARGTAKKKAGQAEPARKVRSRKPAPKTRRPGRKRANGRPVSEPRSSYRGDSVAGSGRGEAAKQHFGYGPRLTGRRSLHHALPACSGRLTENSHRAVRIPSGVTVHGKRPAAPLGLQCRPPGQE